MIETPMGLDDVDVVGSKMHSIDAGSSRERAIQRLDAPYPLEPCVVPCLRPGEPSQVAPQPLDPRPRQLSALKVWKQSLIVRWPSLGQITR